MKMKTFFNLLLLFFVTSLHAQNPAPVKANPFYMVSVERSKNKGVPVQAFATGRSGDTLLLVTGRTNGFHNFPSAPVASFPSNRSNDSFIVYIPKLNKVVKQNINSLLTSTDSQTLMVTLSQLYQLASTNIQSCQSGDTLYGIGGYGYNGSMVTFGGCFAINIPNMINLVLNGGGKAAQISNAICFATNSPNIASTVTGGELLKMNNQYYLVVGQNFNGEYSNNAYAPNNPLGYTQTYTSTITPYIFKWTSATSFSCVAQTPFVDQSVADELHRRDLNIVPVVNSDGSHSMHIYGGVFTPTGGPYLHPVEVSYSNGIQVTTKTSMNQLFNQYAAAHISMYDAKSDKMFTTILGGITLYDSVRASANNDSVKSVTAKDSAMPWSSMISTMVKDNKSRTITEYASDNVRMPGLIGGEAKFIPYSEFLMNGSEEIIDMSKVAKKASVTHKKVKVGIMFGGIISSLAQTSTRSQTQSNSIAYDVYLTMPVTDMQRSK